MNQGGGHVKACHDIVVAQLTKKRTMIESGHLNYFYVRICTTFHELIMGRIYASIPTSHSWGGFMQNTRHELLMEVLCKADLHNLPRKCVHTRYIVGRFYAKGSY